MLNNRSLTVKFALLFLLLLAFLGASYFLILRNIYLAQLQSEARTISDNVIAFGKWVSQHGRVWVRDNDTSYLGKLAVLPLPEGEASAPPADVLARYGSGGGFDFKEGDVAGVISVTIPARSLFATTIGVISGLEIVLVIVAFGISVWFFKRIVINPVQRLTLAANRTSVGESVDLGTAALPPKSGNEIHQLAFALERLRTSMQLAIQRMKASQRPPG